MKPVVLLVCLAALGVGVWLVVDRGEDSEKKTPEPTPSPAPEPAPIEVVRGPGVRPASPDQGSTEPVKPMTVDEYLESVMRKDREEAPGAAPAPVKVERPDVKELLKNSTVTLEQSDESALVVLASIAEQAGVELEIAEDLQEDLRESKITLSLASVSAENALDLVLRLAAPDLSFGSKDGKVVVHRTR